MLENFAKLHVLTLDDSPWSHLEQVEQLLRAGADWVQLRMKSGSLAEKTETALEARRLTREAGATLIINDFVELAHAVRADGVHLGGRDMEIAEARRYLGASAIIGGTANDAQMLQQCVQEGVDYIGLGPYRFTQTKKRLAPVMGAEGIAELVPLAGEVPVVAIGGILPEDVALLMQTGVSGVAVSGAICAQNDIAGALAGFQSSF